MNTNIIIIGQPNTGKSTLFNKIVETKKAITSPIAGTTRDIVSAQAQWKDKTFTIIDTGGLEQKINQEDLINKSVQKQIQFALNQADIILFIIDTKTGITNIDINFSAKLKKIKKPVILIANKADNKNFREKARTTIKLGLGKPQIISAIQGTGIGDLLDKIVSYIKKEGQKITPTKTIKVGFFGKPNVGKSSIINKLLGKSKIIVSDIPGTTRDTIDTIVKYQNQNITLTDTAGIKRKKQAKFGIEKFSIKKSLETIKYCDIVLFIIDANKIISRQDKRIVQRLLKKDVSIILVVNKWDLAEQKKETILNILQKELSFLYWAPIIFTSAKTGLNIKKIYDLILEANKEKQKIIEKKELALFLKKTIQEYPPQRDKKTRKQPNPIKLIQNQNNPPKFNLYLKGSSSLAPKYIQLLTKKLRQKFSFHATPIHITIKRTK